MKLTFNGVIVALTVSLVAFLGGCGPQNLSDADYLAQLSDAGLAKDGDNSDDQGDDNTDKGQDDSQAQDDNNDNNAPATMSASAMPKPVVPVRKLRPINMRSPTVLERQAPVILESSEQREVEQDIHHWKTIVRPQATITNHRIHNVLKKNHIFHTNIVNQPSTCTKVFNTSQVVETQVVEPTVEETAPVRVGCPGVIGGCPARLIPGAGGYPYGYGYNRWLRRY